MSEQTPHPSLVVWEDVLDGRWRVFAVRIMGSDGRLVLIDADGSLYRAGATRVPWSDGVVTKTDVAGWRYLAVALAEGWGNMGSYQ
jgi:hypothetical protein